MNWKKIETNEDIKDIMSTSENENVLLFKYSPNCSINYVVKTLLEREWNENSMNMQTYLADVFNNKQMSSEIENIFATKHESPQALIISKGKQIFNASHGRILFSTLLDYANARNK
jgi:bacillithiol system protein YtxJ